MANGLTSMTNTVLAGVTGERNTNMSLMSRRLLVMVTPGGPKIGPSRWSASDATTTPPVKLMSVGKKLARAEVLDSKRVLPVAGGVDRECEQIAVVTHLERAKRVEAVSLRHLVLVN